MRQDLGRCQLGVTAEAEQAAQDRVAAASQTGGRGQHHRIAQRAAQPRLVALGQHIAADVDAHDEIALQHPGHLS